MHIRLVITAALIFLMVSDVASPVFAAEQATEKKKNGMESSSVQEAINKDKEMINMIMQQNQPPRQPDPIVKDVEFDIAGNQVMGSNKARLIIVQFSDYSCSHCSFHTRETLPDIQKHFIDTGKLRYVVIDYPLLSDLPSVTASEAAHCASDQGKFWEMHEELMFNQTKMADIKGIASSINLDMPDFRVCMEIKKHADTVTKNVALADKLRIPSVPGFILGKVDPENPEKVKGATYIRGAKPFAIFQDAIEKTLAEIER
ncbi:MAG: thioredoxin domain-containing protein [Desulfatiglans sp.]|mgnify:CR=1 FL=1|jgi:protein-disulfide isomerase|nr:thioredoxin domain-containing protein [Desulfatiglans sp.]